MVETDEYSVINSEDDVYSFYSKNKDKIDSTITVSNLTSIASYSDTIFIYGVEVEGLFAYYADTMTSTQLISGDGDFNITSIEENVIYYDDTSVIVE